MASPNYLQSFLNRLARIRKKQTFIFNSFANGLSDDPTKWRTHGFYSAGLDLIGIKDYSGVRTGARPNTLQLSRGMYPDSISGTTVAGDHLTGLVEWIRRWDSIGTGNLYALEPVTSGGSAGIILSSNGGTSTWVSAKQISAAVGGGGLGIISANMYYGQDAVLGQVTSAGVYTNNFGSFTLGKQTPRPMKVFAGKLCIGNDSYISTVDSTQAFTAAALTLPAGFTVRSLEVLGNYLVISADNGAFARIFLWTGGTATYQEAYDISESTAPTLVSREGRIFALGTKIYQLNEVSYSTLFPYSYYGSPLSATDFPMLGETAVLNNKIIYGLDQAGTGLTNGDNIGGVWMMGNYDTNYPYINHLPFILPIGPVSAYATGTVTVGGIYADPSSIVKVAYKDASGTGATVYGIAKLTTDPVNSTNAYYVTHPINGDTDATKLFYSIRLTLEGKANSTVTTYYRTNTNFADIYSSDNPWTLLGTTVVTTARDNSRTLPIRVRSTNIQFKFVFTPTTSGATPQLTEYAVVYEALDQYR